MCRKIAVDPEVATAVAGLVRDIAAALGAEPEASGTRYVVADAPEGSGDG